MRLPFSTLILLLCFCPNRARADWVAKIWPDPIEISATREPFAIRFGQTVIYSSTLKGKVATLSLNGSPLVTDKLSPNSVHIISNSDLLQFTVFTDDTTEKIEIPTIYLPQNLQAKVEGKVLSVVFTSNAKGVKIDGRPFKVTSGSLRLKFGSEAWPTKPHLFEIESTEKLPVRKVHCTFVSSEPEAPPSAKPVPTVSRSETKEAPFLVGLDIDAGFTYLIPSLFFTTKIIKSLTVGIEAGVTGISGTSESSTILSLLGRVDYFPGGKINRGLWFRGSAGVYNFTLSSSGLSESIVSPAVQLSGGWRWNLSKNFYAGLSVGGQYLSTKSGKIFTLDLSGLLPLFTADIALSF